MINIVNFILVRNCNLSCEYCRISGNTNYELKPEEYPDLKYYIENEQPVEKWIDAYITITEVASGGFPASGKTVGDFKQSGTKFKVFPNNASVREVSTFLK